VAFTTICTVRPSQLASAQPRNVIQFARANCRQFARNSTVPQLQQPVQASARLQHTLHAFRDFSDTPGIWPSEREPKVERYHAVKMAAYPNQSTTSSPQPQQRCEQRLEVRTVKVVRRDTDKKQTNKSENCAGAISAVKY
jgi:hypothetical protein